MKYKLVREETSSQLENVVNGLIQEGWVPQGGVCVYSDGYIGYDKQYVQAMIKQVP